ncbi:hypothetical protein ONS96_009889 [Cadophora gregata f. sp. sojae]|nr:hypothetical protein ONS96_009889 [Cadophora gregata f. sp. sojae]
MDHPDCPTRPLTSSGGPPGPHPDLTRTHTANINININININTTPQTPLQKAASSMASSADRDKDTNPDDKQSNPDNPFIKFRQFADTQISSLLQGIIGLPSAFSKRPSDDPRWAGIDDGLRRRDELQARQKELKESEARKLQRQTADEEHPFTRTMDRTDALGEGYQPLGEQENKSEMPTKDLPLYSAVRKSLFTHLQIPDFDEADWNDLNKTPAWGENGFLVQYYPLKVLPHQRSSFFDRDCMTMTHCLVYNDLNSSSSLRSEYSLLPYLLFSPYSPLKLENDFHRSYFRWSAAFEDLIATSQPPKKLSAWQFIAATLPATPAVSPEGNLHWISKLKALGYLQEKKCISDDDHEALDHQLSIMLYGSQKDKEWVDTDDETSSGKPSVTGLARDTRAADQDLEATKSPRTEQEMYDHFLKWASSPQAIKEVFQAGEAFLASLENDDPSGRRREQDGGFPRPPSLMREIFEVTKAFRELSEPQHSSSDAQQSDRTTQDVRTAESPDRVVSSSTTTEQTVHEDGTVETCVTVWKKFNSGRETSTTTHHCEDPATTESRPDEVETSPKVLEKGGNEIEKVNQNGKSGWFWN